MNQVNQDLLELQKIDIRIKALQGFLDALPDKKSELDSLRGQARERVESKRSELEAAKQELRRQERRLEQGEEKLKSVQARLNQVKTNKEYEAALKEIEEQKQKNGGFEEAILRLYDQVEEADAQREKLEADWNEQKLEFDRSRQGLENKAAGAETELEEQKGKRDGLLENIPPGYLEHYEKIRTHSGRGVARAVDEVCQGCYRRIPAQMYNEVLKGDRVVTCNICFRILVHTDGEIAAGLEEV